MMFIDIATVATAIGILATVLTLAVKVGTLTEVIRSQGEAITGLKSELTTQRNDFKTEMTAQRLAHEQERLERVKAEGTVSQALERITERLAAWNEDRQDIFRRLDRLEQGSAELARLGSEVARLGESLNELKVEVKAIRDHN